MFELITSRWTLLVLWALKGGTLRLFQLLESVEGISERVLSDWSERQTEAADRGLFAVMEGCGLKRQWGHQRWSRINGNDVRMKRQRRDRRDLAIRTSSPSRSAWARD